MLELNKVLLTGRLTFDPEIRHTSSGMAVCDLKIASNRRGYGDRADEVLFIQVTAWGKTAEFCSQYLSKGKGIYVEGRLKLDSWQDKKDGSKRERVSIVADRVQFAESRAEEEQRSGGGGGRSEGGGGYDRGGSSSGNAPAGGAPPDKTDDDLPF